MNAPISRQLRNEMVKIFSCTVSIRPFIAATAILMLFVFAQQADAATITVNSNADNINCDSSITYREAVLLANDGTGSNGLNRAITNAEKNLIGSGPTYVAALPPLGCSASTSYWIALNGIGQGLNDNINFDNSVTVINITDSLFPTFRFSGDTVNGLKPNGTKAILDGTNAGEVADGMILENQTFLIFNLEVRNFGGDGIVCESCDNSYFRGLNIHNNGGHGLYIYSILPASGNPQNDTIGGTGSDQGNVIYSNGLDGIHIKADLNYDRNNENIVILNNLIGTQDGTTASPNGGRGIVLENAFGVTIGDTTGLTKNIISGNASDGILITGSGAVSNTVIWNNIGTDINGGARLANGASGVAFSGDAGDGVNFTNSFPNRIGIPGFPNVISGNNGFGIYVSGTNTSNNNIQSNLIGTNSGGNVDLGNAFDGIYFVGGTYDNLVGGTGANEGNLIAFNAKGIKADSGVRNAFRRNRVFSNDNIGIDLAPLGVTPNDAGDGDTGPNNLQNYPVITYVNAQATFVTLSGTLNSTPNQTFTLEFFGNSGADASGYGEGLNFLGSTQVTTNAGGNATFNNLNLAATLSNVGSWVTATATDALGNTSEYSLARNICSSMLFSPTDVIAPTGGGPASFSITYSSGCNSYTAQSNVSWITVNSVAGGIVNYTVAANHTPPRDGLITITYNNGSGAANQSFLISQNNGCTYPFSHSSISYTAAGTASDAMSVGAGTGCQWTAASNAAWITITSGANYSGFGTVTWTVPVNTGAARQGTMTIAGQTFTVNQAAAVSTRGPFDFDGDGKTDVSVFRPNGASSEWWYLKSSNGGNGAAQFGVSTDQITPADFTGDGKTDIAVFRPASGQWLILRSEDFSFYAFPFGANGDVPVPADYDADGKADAAVFRPSTSTWYISRSTGGTTIFTFGANGDLPAVADYDGDGKADIGIFRPSLGQWWIQRSTAGLLAVQFGQNGDKTVQGDFTGDGKADIAYFRPSTGYWTVLRSENLSFYAFPFGSTGDTAAPGDYDGDGKTDAAVFRPSTSTWYVQRSTAGTLIQQFGQAGDLPVPAAFVR